jgi:hypothetical protein
MKLNLARIALGAALAIGVTTGLAATAGAQVVPASITIHHRLCGDNYLGGDPFVECHDVLVGTALDFTIDGPVEETDAADLNTGNVTFDDLPAGVYEITGGVPGDFSNAMVYCTDQTSGDALEVVETDNGVEIDIAEDAEVVCDWYEFPEDLSGIEDGDGEGVTELPNTGAGVTAAAGATGAAWLLLPAMMAGGLAVGARRVRR